MKVVFWHAWMQKHPTPTKSGGDFHWHPATAPAAIRNTLTDLATRSRAQSASLWIIDRGYVAWARAFSARAPSDRRRYTGLAVTVAQTDSADFAGAIPEILARMPLPEPGPFTDHELSRSVELDATPGANAPLAVDPDSLRRLFSGEDRELAAALVFGGHVFSHEPQAERLPALVGRLLSWLPPGERVRPRSGVFSSDRPGPDGRVQDSSRGQATDNFLHYLTAAWYCPDSIRERRPGFAVTAWQLVLDLAADRGDSLAELFADLTAVAGAWDTVAHLRGLLIERGVLGERDIAECDRRAPAPLCADTVQDAGWMWSRLLHYWGRGFLPDAILPRLAALLARRVAADHLFHLDAPEQNALPGRYMRRLGHETLLPLEYVAAMTHAVEQHLPSLSRTNEVPLG